MSKQRIKEQEDVVNWPDLIEPPAVCPRCDLNLTACYQAVRELLAAGVPRDRCWIETAPGLEGHTLLTRLLDEHRRVCLGLRRQAAHGLLKAT